MQREQTLADLMREIGIEAPRRPPPTASPSMRRQADRFSTRPRPVDPYGSQSVAGQVAAQTPYTPPMPQAQWQAEQRRQYDALQQRPRSVEAYQDPRNQFAEAGEYGLEMTGLPSIRRSAGAFADNRPREGFEEGALGLLGVTTLGVGGRGARAPRPMPDAPPMRAPVAEPSGALRPPPRQLGTASDGPGGLPANDGAGSWQRPVDYDPYSDIRAEDMPRIRNELATAMRSEGAYRGGEVLSRVQTLTDEQAIRAWRILNANGPRDLHNFVLGERRNTPLARQMRGETGDVVPMRPPSLPGRASDGSVMPVRPPEPFRQSMVGGSDDLAAAARPQPGALGNGSGREGRPNTPRVSELNRIAAEARRMNPGAWPEDLNSIRWVQDTAGNYHMAAALDADHGALLDRLRRQGIDVPAQTKENRHLRGFFRRDESGQWERTDLDGNFEPLTPRASTQGRSQGGSDDLAEAARPGALRPAQEEVASAPESGALRSPRFQPNGEVSNGLRRYDIPVGDGNVAKLSVNRDGTVWWRIAGVRDESKLPPAERSRMAIRAMRGILEALAHDSTTTPGAVYRFSALTDARQSVYRQLGEMAPRYGYRLAEPSPGVFELRPALDGSPSAGGLYHGTSRDYDWFDLSAQPSRTGNRPGERRALWLTSSEAQGDEFARLQQINEGGTPRVIQVDGVEGRVLVHDARGDLYDDVPINQILDLAEREGYAGVRFRNMREDIGEGPVPDQVAVFDVASVRRSPNAPTRGPSQ